MSKEKLQRAIDLLQECLNEYDGEEADEGMPDAGYEDESDPAPMMSSGNDKIKMAAALMKRGRQ